LQGFSCPKNTPIHSSKVHSSRRFFSLNEILHLYRWYCVPIVNFSIEKVLAKNVNKGEYNIEVSIVVICEVFDDSGNVVQTLPNKVVNSFSAGGKVTFKWNDSALPPVGNHTALITIEGNPTVEESVPFRVMGAGGGGSSSGK